MRTITIPEYPQDFSDFSNGVNISDKEINEWISEGINTLEQNLKQSSAGCSSGNTKVMVDRYSDDDLEEDYYYEINVSKGYKQSETSIMKKR